MPLTHLPLTDLLAMFRSSEPTPGGGSASALAGAVGASLLVMVAGLAKPRAEDAEGISRLLAAGRACEALSTRLSALVDRDSDAYDMVVAAFRMPKGSDEEKRDRGLRIQEALQAATEVPLEIMRACAEALDRGAVVAVTGNRNAASDTLVGFELLAAGLRGARANVEINLGSIKDAVFVAASRVEAAKLAATAESGLAAARTILTGAA